MYIQIYRNNNNDKQCSMSHLFSSNSKYIVKYESFRSICSDLTKLSRCYFSSHPSRTFMNLSKLSDLATLYTTNLINIRKF